MTQTIGPIITKTTASQITQMKKLTMAQTKRSTHFPTVTNTQRTTFTTMTTSQQINLFRQSVHQLQCAWRQRSSCLFSQSSIGCSIFSSIHSETVRHSSTATAKQSMTVLPGGVSASNIRSC